MKLHIEINKRGWDAWIMALKGPLDVVSYEEFDRQAESVLEHGARHVLLDMSGIDLISTSGLDVIFGVKKTLEERGGSLSVYDPHDKVKRVFEIVKLNNLLIHPENLDDTHPFYAYLKDSEQR